MRGQNILSFLARKSFFEGTRRIPSPEKIRLRDIPCWNKSPFEGTQYFIFSCAYPFEGRLVSTRDYLFYRIGIRIPCAYPEKILIVIFSCATPENSLIRQGKRIPLLEQVSLRRVSRSLQLVSFLLEKSKCPFEKSLFSWYPFEKKKSRVPFFTTCEAFVKKIRGIPLLEQSKRYPFGIFSCA